METMLVIIGLMLIGSVVLTTRPASFILLHKGLWIFARPWSESSGLCAIKLPLKIKDFLISSQTWGQVIRITSACRNPPKRRRIRALRLISLAEGNSRNWRSCFCSLS